MSKGKDKSEQTEKSRGKVGKGGVMKIVLAAVLLIGVGAGGVYAAFAAGMFGAAGEKAGPNEPKLVLKGEKDPYAIAGGEKEQAAPVYGEGGSKYRTAYYSFEESFTTNLADSPGLMQVEIAVSTRRDGRVLQWVQTHELAIRSAILAQLATTTEAEAYDIEGKKRLARRLTDSINEVLEENEGFGGIEAVHFRGFIVQ